MTTPDAARVREPIPPMTIRHSPQLGNMIACKWCNTSGGHSDECYERQVHAFEQRLAEVERQRDRLVSEAQYFREQNILLTEWRADVTVSLQREQGAFFADVPKHIKDLVAERDALQRENQRLRENLANLTAIIDGANAAASQDVVITSEPMDKETAEAIQRWQARPAGEGQ